MNVKRFLIVLAFVFVAVLLPAVESNAVSDATASGDESFERVSVETLGEAFEANPYRAQKTYQGKNLEVSGKIYGFKSINKEPIIYFIYSQREVNCYVSENDPLIAEVTKGENATIRGYVSEVNPLSRMQEYTLTNCKIISAN
ncbi:MAG: hypothetical protein IJP89_05790 [Synergistaceae bacterium]|nr:hypothetical protein [Synergistaceae bacterium]MBR0256716.1 hypothetical protein [Synergistaceae bacterium]